MCLKITCRVCLDTGGAINSCPPNLRVPFAWRTTRWQPFIQCKMTWWVRFYYSCTRQLIRESLLTHDAAKAELLRERIELDAALLEPRFQAADIPTTIWAALGVPDCADVQNGDAPAIPSV